MSFLPKRTLCLRIINWRFYSQLTSSYRIMILWMIVSQDRRKQPFLNWRPEVLLIQSRIKRPLRGISLAEIVIFLRFRESHEEQSKSDSLKSTLWSICRVLLEVERGITSPNKKSSMSDFLTETTLRWIQIWIKIMMASNWSLILIQMTWSI